MLTVGAIGFLQPLFLIGLAALPVLWWLLRATPPTPTRVAFPGVRILLGLDDRERTPQRTPWWLLLLRIVAAGLLLLAFAEPLVNPKARTAGEGPLLIVFDGGWTSASDWAVRRDEAVDAAARASEQARPVAVVSLSAPGPAPDSLQFGSGEEAIERVTALVPQPWRARPERLEAALADAAAGGLGFETLWLTDGLAAPRVVASAGEGEGEGEGVDAPIPEENARATLLQALSERGPVTLLTPETAPLALRPPLLAGEGLVVTAARPLGAPTAPTTVRIAAYGRVGAEDEGDGGATAAGVDAAAQERRLAATEAVFEEGASDASAEIALPLELRNAVTRIEIVGQNAAGAVSLLDDRYRRRAVALVVGDETRRGQPLLSDLHYLRSALAPHAAAREMPLRDALGLERAGGIAAAATLTPAGQEAESDPERDALREASARAWADVIVLSDVGRLDAETAEALDLWVRAGGLLLRFAGPRLAALAAEATQPSARARFGAPPPDDALLPTPLRGGGRALGGALSWSEPQGLRPFPEASPFAGLTAPEEVTVRRQVLAEPGPDLAQRTWASLTDGTPLVTARDVGRGRVVLFHVTASAAWSNLPLSGLFVDMIGRVVSAAPGIAAGEAALAEAARAWTPAVLLDGFGRVAPAAERAEPVSGAVLAAAAAAGPTPGVSPGVYEAETAEGVATLALNAFGAGESFEAAAAPPAGVAARALQAVTETALKPALLAAALALLALDALAALYVAGRLRRPATAGALVAVLLAAAATAPPSARAQADPGSPVDRAERRASVETVLAHVLTGDAAVDRMSRAGLLGLSATLNARTAIEPGEPAGVDIERDEIAVYSVLYWPITARQPTPSDAAVRKLNAFLSTGGMLVVDTRDGHQAVGGQPGPNGQHLRRLLGEIDLPALEPLPRDHVLTRTFYLIDGAPGRWRSNGVWVEAGGATGLFDGDGLREADPNDGVSPVVIGDADWAGAWAVTLDGDYLAPMGRGGESQREQAFRFGVNLVMYAFTGNYKSDQVHIPTLLERLGN